jgi:hypothetical protein
VFIKGLERNAFHYYSKIILKCPLSNVETRMQDDFHWDNSEERGEGASSSENESATEGSLKELLN